MPAFDSSSMLNNILLALATIVVIVVAYAIITRMRREAHGLHDEEQPTSLLASFQEAYDRGEIDAEEYQRVRHSLERQGASGVTGSPYGARPLKTPEPESPTPPEAETPPPASP